MTRLSREGIATIALGMIVEYVFNNFDVERVYAEPYAYNTASRRVLEKNGFICEAILKKYVIKNNVLLDSCIYSILRVD
jgi:RimJ/RimL family protein N-acetyltransferase